MRGKAVIGLQKRRINQIEPAGSGDAFHLFDRAKRGDGPAMTLAIDAFNILNRVNDVGYIGTLSSPFFGRAVAAHSPRRLQLSVRTRF